MTPDFVRVARDARRVKKPFARNGLWLRRSIAMQTVKRAAIPYVASEVADRYAKTVSSFEHELSHRFLEMDMLMRIEMCGVARTERVQLSIEFRCDRFAVPDRNALVVRPPRAVAVRPLAEIYVEADAESLPPLRRCDCRRSVGPADQEARARDDAAIMRFGDPAIMPSLRPKSSALTISLRVEVIRTSQSAGC